MNFIQPKQTEPVNLQLSDQTRAILEYYAQYTNYSPDEVADMFLKNILQDGIFIEWVRQRRNNKRMLSRLMLDEVFEPKDNVVEMKKSGS